MSTQRRPAPRRSALSDATPLAPAPAQAPNAPAPPSLEAAPAPRPTRGARPKVSFYQAREDTNRMRGAILHTMAAEGPRSLSEFIHQAVMAEVERLETKYNNGQPFPPVGARELPQGRPLGD